MPAATSLHLYSSHRRWYWALLISVMLLSACSMTTSPLHSLIRDGQDRDALQLIERREAVNDRDQLGYTPLHIAAIRNNLNLAEALLENGADLDPRDFHGRTPFMLALREGHADLARYFLDRGAVLHSGYTLTNTLFDALTGRNRAMTEYLLQHGFSPDTSNRVHTTALHVAAATGDVNLVNLLIDRGARLDRQDDDGWNALHFAAARQHRDCVRRLLAAGAQPTRLANDALGAYATGVIHEENALAGAGRSDFIVAADHFRVAADLYQNLAGEVQQQIEAQHAKNALAMVAGAFALAIQPGTPMPTVRGGTVRLYQPVVVPLQDSTTLQSARDAYLASMRDALMSEQRCRDAAAGP